MYILVLDDANIEPTHWLPEVRRQAREFIEQYFGAGDIASIAYTSGTTDASQDFTEDPQVLLACYRPVRRQARGVRGGRNGEQVL